MHVKMEDGSCQIVKNCEVGNVEMVKIVIFLGLLPNKIYICILDWVGLPKPLAQV